MTAITNAENLRHYQSGFYLIAEQTLAFTWSPNMVGKEKMSPNLKQIVLCFTLSNIVIWIVGSILLLNSKHFHQKLYSNSL